MDEGLGFSEGFEHYALVTRDDIISIFSPEITIKQIFMNYKKLIDGKGIIY